MRKYVRDFNIDIKYGTLKVESTLFFFGGGWYDIHVNCYTCLAMACAEIDGPGIKFQL